MTQDTPTRFRGFQGPNYTQVPDAVFDELLPDLTGAELKVLLYIIRRTFGFKRDSDHISLSQMLRGIRTKDGRELDRGVGLTKKTLLAAINSLEQQNIILTERRRSVDRGDEPTTYRLNVVEPARGGEITPPVGEKLHQGGGEEIPPGPWRKNSPTQETGLQETGRQETETLEFSSLSLNPEVSLSTFRKGAPKNLDDQAPRKRSAPLPATAPTGFASVGAVLHAASHPTGGEPTGIDTATTEPRGPRRVPATRTSEALSSTVAQVTSPGRAAPAAGKAVSRTEKAESGRKDRRTVSDTPAAQTSVYSEERELVAAYIRDFGLEFHDRASLKASVTRALRLLSESGYPRERWSEKLYEARGLTKERSAAVGYQGDGNPRAGQTAFGLNKMPYFFGVLECVLGLHDHPAGQHPLPLSEHEFKRQQGRSAQGRRDSSNRQSSTEQSDERPSLAGKFAHLVHR